MTSASSSIISRMGSWRLLKFSRLFSSFTTSSYSPPLPEIPINCPKSPCYLQPSFCFPRVVFFSSQTSDVGQGPAAIDCSSLLPEEEFHKLADETIHDLQEKLEEFGDEVQIDGFDIDYGNQVLTLKLGNLGTYVVNKQTPNRQIWLSSPVSGPSRFDWDRTSQSWVYRRTKANLLQLLEDELGQLCGKTLNLS